MDEDILYASNKAIVIAARGLVSIRDGAGRRILVTPQLARDLAENLPRFADIADGLKGSVPVPVAPPHTLGLVQ